MRLAAHQPDLLPYPGFWVKMARADLFDVAIHDQFVTKGYQRRVLMRGQWASVPVVRPHRGAPIDDVRLTPTGPDVLIDQVVGRYRGSRNWTDLGDQVCGWIDEARSERLWLFNLALIVSVADWLGIRTPLSISAPPGRHGLAGLLDVCGAYPAATSYLSGDGGRSYMGEDPMTAFHDSGLALEWMDYSPPTPDSILSVLFDWPDPRSLLR